MVSDRLPRVTSEDAEELRGFIRKYVADSGASGVVVGISGGIDSAVVVKLAADALGSDKVHTVFMPTDVTPKADYDCTKKLSEIWGVGYEVINIQPAVEVMSDMLGGDLSKLETGNISARCRMTVLYARAKRLKCIVLGTSNQSEYMMGYFTKHGDGASDAAPLVGLYKTNVRQLAKIIGVPQAVIDKPPSAGLWEGQTDEDDMGITYAVLDTVLLEIEKGRTDGEIAGDCGLSVEEVARIRAGVAAMAHKRKPPARPGSSF